MRKRLGLVPNAARNCRASVQRSRPASRSSSSIERRSAGAAAMTSRTRDRRPSASVPDVRAVPEAAPTSRFATVTTSSIRATSSMSSSKSQTSAAPLAGRRAASNTGCPTKGNGLPWQRFLDKPGIDVDDPVAKTCIGARPAVVRLVGMQDVALARKAVPPLAPEAERLDARKGNADRIGVVAMRGKSLTMEVRLHALDPFGARRDPDAIAAAFAQSFKTSPAARR